jgi:hypothetical protein
MAPTSWGKKKKMTVTDTDALAALAASGLVSRRTAVTAHIEWLDNPASEPEWVEVACAALHLMEQKGWAGAERIIRIPPTVSMVPPSAVELPDGNYGMTVIDAIVTFELEPYLPTNIGWLMGKQKPQQHKALVA